MKAFRALLAVVAVTVLAGCAASTEPKADASPSVSVATSQSTALFSGAPAAENVSLVKYANKRIVVFILVDEAGFKSIGDQVKVDRTKEPNGISLTRTEAAQVLGSDKTTSVDAKLLPAEKGQENYWATTKDKVGALLNEF